MADIGGLEKLLDFLQKLAEEHAEMKSQLHVERQMTGMLFSIALQRFPETAEMLSTTRTVLEMLKANDPAQKAGAEAIIKRIDELAALKKNSFNVSTTH